MKRKIAMFLAVAALLVAIAIVSKRQTLTTPAPAIAEPVRPSPIVDQIPRLPLQIIDEKEFVRTRTADSKSPKKTAESLDNVAGTSWAVVAAIYRDYDAAERRVNSLMKSSKFQPTVFPSKGEGSKYMVVLGSGLTRAKAEETRERAIAEGMPADTYVTKLGQ
jgi:hypothetical protein